MHSTQQPYQGNNIHSGQQMSQLRDREVGNVSQDHNVVEPGFKLDCGTSEPTLLTLSYGLCISIDCLDTLQQKSAYFVHYTILRVTSLKSSRKNFQEVQPHKYIKQNNNQNIHS